MRKKKLGHRIITFMMILLMVFNMMPVDLLPMELLAEGTEYTWDGEAPTEELENITVVNVSGTATGTLKLTASEVTFKATEYLSINAANIELASSVQKVFFESSNSIEFGKIEYAGTGDLHVGANCTVDFVEFVAIQANEVIFDTERTIWANVITGNIGKLCVKNGQVRSKRIDAKLNTLEIIHGTLQVATEGTSFAIREVGNLYIHEEGRLQAMNMMYTETGVVAPAAITFAEDAVIYVDGSLYVGGLSNEYAQDAEGGSAIKFLGNATIIASKTSTDSRVQIYGGAAGANAQAGHAIDAAGNVLFRLYEGASIDVAGGDWRSAAGTGSGDAGRVVNGSGAVNVEFYSTVNNPQFTFSDGDELRAGATEFQIKTIVPGRFWLTNPGSMEITLPGGENVSYDDNGYLIGADGNYPTSLTVKGGLDIKTNQDPSFRFAEHTGVGQPLFLYSGVTKNEPQSNIEYVIDGTSFLTDENGYLCFEMAGDGECTVAGPDDLAFTLTISDGLITAITPELPGISIINNGRGIQRLTAPEVELTFTAEQVDGISNLKRTEKIKITFSEPVVTAPRGVVRVNGQNVDVVSDTDGDAKTWLVDVWQPLESVANGENVEVSVESWDNYSVSGGPASVTVYKRGTEYGYSVVQLGGMNQLADTEQLLVTFDTDLSDNLLASRLTLTGATIDAVTDNGDANAKTWLIDISNISVANGEKCGLKIADGDEYSVSSDVHEVIVYRSVTKQVSFDVEEIGGESGEIRSTGILLTFSEDVQGLTKNKVTVAGATVEELTDNGDGDSKTWLAKISGSFVDEASAQVSVANWTGDKHYEAPSSKTVILYQDTRTVVDYVLERIDGVDGKRQTKTIAITFDEPVADFSLDKIDLGGQAVAKSVEMVAPLDAKNWKLNLESHSLENGDNLAITINDWRGINVQTQTKEVKVWQTNEITYLAVQVGGASTTKTTTGILVTFNQAISQLEMSEVFITGATITSITDNGDDLDHTWLFEIDQPVKNNTVVEIIIGGDDSVLCERDIKMTPVRLETYVDEQTYVKMTQIGGVDGEVNTSLIKVETTRMGMPYPSTLYHAFVDGQYMPHYQDPDNSHISFIQLYGNTIFNPSSGPTSEVEVTFQRIPANVIGEKQSVVLYKDKRVVVTPTLHEVGGEIGVEDSTKLLLKDTKCETLSESNLTITGLEATDWHLVKTAGTAGNNVEWQIILDNIPGDQSKMGITLEISGISGYNFMPTSYKNDRIDDVPQGDKALYIFKDLREPISITNVVQYGGENGVVNSKGVEITFDKPLDDPSWFNVSISKGDKEFKVVLQETNNPLVYHALFNYGKGVKNGDIFDVKVSVNKKRLTNGGWGQIERSKWKIVSGGTNQTILYAALPPQEERYLLEVVPQSIHMDSHTKIITLAGNFGPEGANSLTELYFFKEGNATPFKIVKLPKLTNAPATGIYHTVQADVSNVLELKTLGTYMVAFKAQDGFISKAVPFEVVDNAMYSSDVHGILTVTQKADKSFVVETFAGENEMNSKRTVGTLLITFRGGAMKTGDGEYIVRGGSTLNKALQYSADSGSNIIVTHKGGKVKISNASGTLKWNSLPVASKFSISLDNAVKYTNIFGGAQPVELIPDGNQESTMQVSAFQAEFSNYKLYVDSASVSGHIGVDGVVPYVTTEANITLHNMLLENKYTSLPPLHAEGGVEFDGSGTFGSVLTASGEFGVELNTLDNPRYLGMNGNIDVCGKLYLEGEFVLKWGEINGKMAFVPDTLKFFGRSDVGGVPLVPPVVVGYLNGVGGGVTGLADTVFNNYTRIPPIQLSVSGAFEDVTGLLLSIEKATIHAGAASFRIDASKAEVLKFIELSNVYAEMGIKGDENVSDSLVFYVGAGGKISLLNDLIYGEADFRAELYGKYLSRIGKDKGALYNAFDFNGTAKVGAKVTVFGIKMVDAYGMLGASKKELSGELKGTVINLDFGVRAVYNIKEKSFTTSKIRSLISQEVVLAGGADEGTLVATNLKTIGTYGGQTSSSARSFVAVLPTSVSSRVSGEIVTIQSDTKVDSVEVFKDGVSYQILSDLEWHETADEYKSQGNYSTLYQIPEDGNYTFSAKGVALGCLVTAVIPTPEIESITVDGASNKVEWNINDVAENSMTPLFVKASLVDVATGDAVATLNNAAGETSVAATEKELSYVLPETLSSGNYRILLGLFEKVTVEGEVTERYFTVVDSDDFAYTNTEAPAAVVNVDVTAIGNGKINVSWDALSGADGYKVSFLDENGTSLENIEPIIVTASENSVHIQGGVFTTQQISDDEQQGKEYGLEYAKDYMVSVQGFVNKTLNTEGLDIDDSLVGNQDSIAIPIYGSGTNQMFSIAAPSIPNISVEVDNATTFIEEEGITWHGINSHDVNIKITGASDIVVKDSEGNLLPENNSSFTFTVQEDGRYSLSVEAKEGNDVGYDTINLLVDTEKPIISIDSESRIAIKGKVQINGLTEPTVQMSVNQGTSSIDGTSFTIEDQIEEGVTAYQIYVKDLAGNETILEFPVVYGYEGEKPINPIDPEIQGNWQNTPNTGDSIQLIKLSVVMLLSMVGVITLVYKKRRDSYK